MLLAKCLIYALDDDEIWGVKVYCDASIAEKVNKTFTETFEVEWKKALAKAEEKYGRAYLGDDLDDDLEESDYLPVSTQYKEYGLFISVGPLKIEYGFGDYCDLEYGSMALDIALSTIKEQFPSIEYDGLIAYKWSDVRCGDVVQYEVSSKKIKRNNDTVYDFVGEALACHLNREADEFWRVLSEELGFEADEFWRVLSDELSYGDEEKFIDFAESLYAYKEWIGLENMQRAFNRVIDILSETHPEKRDSLNAISKRILAGEKVQKKVVDTSDLPDGFMEAFEMFMMAEELGSPKPKRGEIISSEETFDIVIAKAEAGDAEAKFTAGKYFIADHIENERKRSIMWIKEAAESGIDEAVEYISKHKDLFE